MKIIADGFQKEIKKLKKYNYEKDIYDKVLNHIKMVDNYESLKNHVISKMYGFEELKHELSGYCSFNLCKNGGKIRLIIKTERDNASIKLIYISTDHYEDFKRAIK